MPFRLLAATGVISLVLAACSQPATLAPTSTPMPTTPPPTATPANTPTPAPGNTRTDAHGIEQVWVPAGTFLMGTTAEQVSAQLALDPPGFVRSAFGSETPQRPVEITKGYWIDKYEVTNAAFDAFVQDGGYDNQALWSEAGWAWRSEHTGSLPRNCYGDQPTFPRVCVTWFEAEAYAAWRGGRLPTEAEWEYAARGPDGPIYPWGDTFDPALANVLKSPGPLPVGSYPGGVSWVGAHDMAGNAMEWVQDWLDPDYYEQAINIDPPGPETGIVKVEKGGWWGSNPFVARSAYRHFEDPPDYQDSHIGFRIVTEEAP
jgi:formylglycine-generating enzyme required for sulfatase activity